MATDGGGIIQEIELMLDAASVAKLQSEVSSALKDGTNPTAAVSNLDKVEGKLGSLGTAAKEVRRIFAEFGLLLGFAEIVKQIVSANIEFEHLSAQLVSFTGSAAKAHDAIEALEDISRKAPFTVQDLTDAYIRFRNNGINPTTEEMLHFGNIAAANGKSIETVALAIQSMLTGRALGLRQFGIHATQEGDNLRLVFRGQTTEITNNAASITKFLDDLGKNQFGTAAADQANTLGGAFIMLRSTVDRLFISLGEAGLSGALTGLVKWATALIDKLAESEKSTGKMATAVHYLSAGLTVGFAVIKEVGLDVWDLFGAVILTVKGNIEAVHGAFQSFTGDFIAGAENMRRGAADVAAAGAKIQGIGTRASDTENIIDAAKARLDLQAEHGAAVTNPAVRAFLGLDPKGETGDGSAPTTPIRPPKLPGAAKDVIGDRVKLLKELASVTTDAADKTALLARAERLINTDLAAHNHTLDQTIKRIVELGGIQKERAKTASDALAARSARDSSFLRMAGVFEAGGGAPMMPTEAFIDAPAVKKAVDEVLQSVRDDVHTMGFDVPAFADTPLGQFFTDMQSVVVGMSGTIVESIGGALQLIGSDARNAGSSLGNIFKGFADAGLKELERLAIGKVAEDIGHAFDEFAAASAAAANPYTAWMAAGHITAADAALLAAGKWALIGGAAMALGGIGGTGGGGGGGNYATQAGATGLNTYESPQDRLAAAKQHTIQITVNAFDKNNPIDQNLLADALYPAIERSGNKYLIGGR